MKKGFTLIELLVVIAIVAILSVVVILVINPAELLAQARDSNRINDLQNIKTALATFIADGQATTTGATGSLGDSATPKCYSHTTGFTSSTARYGTACTLSNNTGANSQKTDSTGWIPVNLTLISSGSPLPALPVDPRGNADPAYYYTYRPSSGYTFELTALLESNKYANTSTGPMATDGGRLNTLLEIGTVPGLNL